VHFSSSFWIKPWSNYAKPNLNPAGSRTSATLRARAWPRQPGRRPTDRARTPVHRCDRRSHSPAPTSPPSTPSPSAAHPRAEQTDLRRPTNGITTVPRPHRPCRRPTNRASPPLCVHSTTMSSWLTRKPSLQALAAYKRQDPYLSREPQQSRRRRHWHPTRSSTSRPPTLPLNTSNRHSSTF
jgi:hypothetical protein